MGPDAPPLSVRAAQRVGLVLKGKWRLDALIGMGGMASVYAATHRNGSRVAIKMLNPEYAAQPDFVARFMREGYVANKITHPSSVLVLDDDMDDGCAFLVMELLSGHSLERYARRGGPLLPLGHVLRIADDALGLLSAAHAVGILHRDIKPANIHLTAEGLVKVLDFGIARLVEGDGGATQTGTAIGTPSYMPPEQARGRWNMVDARTDVWALGATMHALILGARPRIAETVQEEMLLAMTAPLTSLRETAPGTPAAVIELIERATAFDMSDRWPDAATMQAALRDVVNRVLPGLSAAPGAPLPPPLPAGSAPRVVGAEPGSRSGPGMDSARLVPVRAAAAATAPERESSTLEGTDASPPPTPRLHSPKRLVAAATATLVLALGAAAFVRTARRAPVVAETSFGEPSTAGETPALAVPAPAPRPAPAPPPVAAAPPDVSPPAEATPTQAPPAPTTPAASPPTVAPAHGTPVAVPSPSTTPAKRPPRQPAHALPNTSSPLFDERF